MKSFTPLVALFIILRTASAAHAQSNDGEREILQLVETWRLASERADIQVIDSLLAPEYKISRPGGIQQSRASTMANVRQLRAEIEKRSSADSRMFEITYTNVVIRQYGDLAVVTYHSHYKPLLDIVTGESDHETMRVLRRHAGRWAIVDGHGAIIPKSCPAGKAP